MHPTFHKLENGNLEIHITLPWKDVQSGYSKEVDDAVSKAEITGFRAGKAPRDLVEPKLNRDQIYSQAIQKLLPDAYTRVINENELKPILHPKISIAKGEEGSDWEFIAITCEAPKAVLPSKYTDEIKKLEVKDKEKKLEPILDFLHDKSQVQIPDLLVEEESNHRLSQLIENITRLGLTTESYLATKKLTAEDLKSQTATQARTDLVMEFVLNEIRVDQKLADRKSTLDFLASLV